MTMLQCLVVQQTLELPSGFGDKPVINVSRRTVDRDSFINFLGKRSKPSGATICQLVEKSEECFISNDVLSEHGEKIGLLSKLMEYRDQKAVIVAAFRDGIVRFELGEEAGIRFVILSTNEILVTAVKQDL